MPPSGPPATRPTQTASGAGWGRHPSCEAETRHVGADEDRMETALHSAARRSDATLHVLGPSPGSSPQTVAVTAVFRLSHTGRKASLLTGGNGRRRQHIVLQIPVTRMHLVHVDDGGTAWLKLRPRFQMRPDQRVVRLDEAPVYDAPPSIEALLQDAARNHELEAAYHAQGVAHRSTRLDVTRSWRHQVAESFLRDTSQRALTHRSPTMRRCVIPTERGRMDFDAKRDRGIARDVPQEAYRRFHADIRARRERAEQALVEFHSTYAEKERRVREWIGEHGTADQQARLAAGVLPLEEAVDAMTEEAFRKVDHLPRYQQDGVARLQRHLRTFPPYANATVSELSLHVSTRYLTDATSSQWAVMQELQTAVPEARVYLRERVLSWTDDTKAPRLRFVTVLGYVKRGPLTLRREFCVPETCSPVPEAEGGAKLMTT
jgi:hypothetical protein